MNNFKRGEVYQVDFPGDGGYIIKKERPAVVLQDSDFPRKTVIVAPITGLEKEDGTKKELIHTDVVINASDYPNTLTKDSFIKLEQIQALSRQRLKKKLGKLNEEDMVRLNLFLIPLLGLGEIVETLIQGELAKLAKREAEETGE